MQSRQFRNVNSDVHNNCNSNNINPIIMFSSRKSHPPLVHQYKAILHNYPRFLFIIAIILILIITISLLIFSLLSIPNNNVNRISNTNNDANGFISNSNIILISTTAYKDINEYRYLLARKTVQTAKKYKFNIILVDRSNLLSGSSLISNSFKEDGAIVIESSGRNCRKGCAFRLALQAALNFNDNSDKVIVFFEPEKVDFIRFISSLAYSIQLNEYDLILPSRCYPQCFETLPIEQQHSELFGMFHISNIVKELRLNGWPLEVDWFFGPVLFHSKLANFYLQNNSSMWSAHILPQIQAYHYYNNKGNPLRIASISINYHHPPVQKSMEEGNIQYSNKRLSQLNTIINNVEKALKQQASSELL
jgi:hypothetical protein